MRAHSFRDAADVEIVLSPGNGHLHVPPSDCRVHNVWLHTSVKLKKKRPMNGGIREYCKTIMKHDCQLLQFYFYIVQMASKLSNGNIA